MEQCESTKTESTSDLGKELNVSEKELNCLSESIAELNDKLIPISLRPSVKAEQAGAPPERERCEVDAAIHSINNRISAQTELIRAMISELRI